MTVETSNAHKTEITKTLTIPKPSINNGLLNPQPDRPIVVFSDFDGTVFLQDTGHVLFDRYGCGPERREQLDTQIGISKTFRDASNEMWGSLHVTLPEALDALRKNLVMDKDFRPFFEYTKEHNIPFTIISAGLEPLLRGALETFLGKDDAARISIISNDCDISQDGSSWRVKWRHDSDLGHDKAKSVADFRHSVKDIQPLLVFIGDGVSDLPAARHADVLFARKGLRLEEYCIQHQIPYISYDSFADVKKDLELLVGGNKYHDLRGALLHKFNTSVPSTPRDPLPGYFPDISHNSPHHVNGDRPSNARTTSNMSVYANKG